MRMLLLVVALPSLFGPPCPLGPPVAPPKGVEQPPTTVLFAFGGRVEEIRALGPLPDTCSEAEVGYNLGTHSVLYCEPVEGKARWVPLPVEGDAYVIHGTFDRIRVNQGPFDFKGSSKEYAIGVLQGAQARARAVVP